MMVFVYEYLTALAGNDEPGSSLPASLLAEGRAMVDAVATDLRAIPGIDVCLLEREDPAAFRQLARRADGSLIIAPEFDDILASRCEQVVQAGGRLLGPDPLAVRLTADKWELFQHFRRFDIPTPTTWRKGTEPPFFPRVWKPRFGAGSQDTFLLQGEFDLPFAQAECDAHPGIGEMIAQEYHPGQSVSISFLIGPRQTIALPACSQHLSTDGRFHYLGGHTPIDPDLARRAESLGRRAIAALPGLAGYVGVDLVLGTIDQVIEINPRLTTSYIGLRQLTIGNLAQTLVQVVLGQFDGQLEFRTARIDFTPSVPNPDRQQFDLD